MTCLPVRSLRRTGGQIISFIFGRFVLRLHYTCVYVIPPGYIYYINVRDHWQEWLEDATGDDIWTAHRYIKTSPGDGSRTRVPTLKGKNRDGQDIIATTNEEKGDLLARMLFPPPPPRTSRPFLPTSRTRPQWTNGHQ